MDRFPVLSRALGREGLRLADAYLRGELEAEPVIEDARSRWTPEHAAHQSSGGFVDE